MEPLIIIFVKRLIIIFLDETADVDILEQSRRSFKNLEQSSSLESLEQTTPIDSVPVNSFSDYSETNDVDDVDEISEDLEKLWRNRRMSR